MHPKNAEESSNEKSDNFGVIILAGGRSSRLKVNKVFLNIRREPLICEIVRVASEVTEKVVVTIGKHDQEEKFAEILPSWVKIARDTTEEKAALYGVLTGLKSIETRYTAVLAADLPFVNTNIIRILYREAEGFDLAIPRWPNGDIEPLYAVYQVSAAQKAFSETVESGIVRMRDAINRFGNVNYVPVEHLRSADKSLHCFINLNTVNDLERVRAIMQAEAHPAETFANEI